MAGTAGGSRSLTLQQLLLRLEPHTPFETQVFAVKALPDFVNLELRKMHAAFGNTTEERQAALHLLYHAIGMVGKTKYFKSLTPQMRGVCEARMEDLKRRIYKAGYRQS